MVTDERLAVLQARDEHRQGERGKIRAVSFLGLTQTTPEQRQRGVREHCAQLRPAQVVLPDGGVLHHLASYGLLARKAIFRFRRHKASRGDCLETCSFSEMKGPKST